MLLTASWNQNRCPLRFMQTADLWQMSFNVHHHVNDIYIADIPQPYYFYYRCFLYWIPYTNSIRTRFVVCKLDMLVKVNFRWYEREVKIYYLNFVVEYLYYWYYKVEDFGFYLFYSIISRNTIYSLFIKESHRLSNITLRLLEADQLYINKTMPAEPREKAQKRLVTAT